MMADFSVGDRPSRPSRRRPGTPRPTAASCRKRPETLALDVAAARRHDVAAAVLDQDAAGLRPSCGDCLELLGNPASQPYSPVRTGHRRSPAKVHLACATPSSARQPTKPSPSYRPSAPVGLSASTPRMPWSRPRSFISTSERAMSARARPRRRQARRVKTLCSQPRSTPSAAFSLGVDRVDYAAGDLVALVRDDPQRSDRRWAGRSSA